MRNITVNKVDLVSTTGEHLGAIETVPEMNSVDDVNVIFDKYDRVVYVNAGRDKHPREPHLAEMQLRLHEGSIEVTANMMTGNLVKFYLSLVDADNETCNVYETAKRWKQDIAAGLTDVGVEGHKEVGVAYLYERYLRDNGVSVAVREPQKKGVSAKKITKRETVDDKGNLIGYVEVAYDESGAGVIKKTKVPAFNEDGVRVGYEEVTYDRNAVDNLDTVVGFDNDGNVTMFAEGFLKNENL